MALVAVPGSEKFAYRPPSIDELRRQTEHVPLHSVDTAAIDAVDPMTYEVIRHRLWAITDEMGEALKRMSGSVVVTDANDFDFAIMDELGEEVQIGLYNTELCASMDMAVKWTLEQRATNPGILDGDMFLCNDPWVGGGLHQNDTTLFAPIFHEGEIFGWTCAVAHQVDVGGVSPGSWSVKSMDVFWEGIPVPPVKIVEGGQIRSDIEDVWVRRSRQPKLLSLDLRAMMGANNVAHERFRALIDQYGAQTVKAVMQRVMNDAEQRLRTKLRELPDGTWSGVAHQDQAREGDKNLYRITLSMTKRDDRLIFDFTGTDPQVEGLINCTYAGVRGGITPLVLPMLCGDIPWAPGGIFRCIEIISEDGTLNNCTFPAGISKGAVASAWATQDVVTECLAGLLDTHPEHRHRVMSVCVGSWGLTMLSGVDQYANPFVTMLMDAMAGGLGARVDADGVDTGGLADIPMGRIADVEMNEFSFPMLYLWRREEPNSGGPGRFRGGLGASACFIPHDTPMHGIHLVVSSAGKAIPQSSGISGGYTANTAFDVCIRSSDIRASLTAGQLPTKLEEIHGVMDRMSPQVETDMDWDDVYFTHWQGGGGYGDPLLRDPQHVYGDVMNKKITADAAESVYGVVMDPVSGVDMTATQQRRLEERARRAGISQ